MTSNQVTHHRRLGAGVFAGCFAGCIAIFLAAAAAPVAAQADAPWPVKPVRLLVAFPPGGLADVLTRLLAPDLSKALGQPVVVDNRGGASGNLAALELLRSAGDSHTFMVNVTTIESVNPLMYSNLGFQPAKDFQPVAMLANTQLFLVTRPTLAVNNLKEFVAHAKAHPGKLSYGSAGTGTTPHIGGEMLKQATGIFATHIPYRGAAPAIQDLMASQIDFALMPGTVFQSAKSGKLKLLAVASRQRTDNYPSAPTIDQEGFGKVFVDTPFVVYASASVAAPVVARLNREINQILAMPSIKQKFSEVGADAVSLSPSELKTLVQAEIALFGSIVKSRGITAE